MIDWLKSLICSSFPHWKGFPYFEKIKKLKNESVKGRRQVIKFNNLGLGENRGFTQEMWLLCLKQECYFPQAFS